MRSSGWAAPTTQMIACIRFPGIVGIVLRPSQSGKTECLVVCDSSDSDARGFFQLSTKGNGQLCVGQKLDATEIVTGTSLSQRFVPRGFLSCAAYDNVTGIIFFNDGHDLFALDRNDVVWPVLGALGAKQATGQAGEAVRFCYPAELVVSSPGELYVSDAEGLHLLRYEACTGGRGVLAVCRATLRSHSDDHLGQLSIACTCDGRILSSATALYKLGSPDRCVSLAGCDSWRAWAGEEGMSGSRDGCGQGARFSSITGLGADGEGTIIVVDNTSQGVSLVRCVRRDGTVNTVYNPGGVDLATPSSDDPWRGSSTVSPHEGHDYNGFCDVAGFSHDGNSDGDDRPYAPASSFSGQVSASPAHSFGDDQESLGPEASSLRCPCVLSDGILAVCAPLQHALFLLHVPGLRAPMGHCTAASSVVPASLFLPLLPGCSAPSPEPPAGPTPPGQDDQAGCRPSSSLSADLACGAGEAGGRVCMCGEYGGAEGGGWCEVGLCQCVQPREGAGRCQLLPCQSACFSMCSCGCSANAAGMATGSFGIRRACGGSGKDRAVAGQGELDRGCSSSVDSWAPAAGTMAPDWSHDQWTQDGGDRSFSDDGACRCRGLDDEEASCNGDERRGEEACICSAAEFSVFTVDLGLEDCYEQDHYEQDLDRDKCTALAARVDSAAASDEGGDVSVDSAADVTCGEVDRATPRRSADSASGQGAEEGSGDNDLDGRFFRGGCAGSGSPVRGCGAGGREGCFNSGGPQWPKRRRVADGGWACGEQSGAI